MASFNYDNRRPCYVDGKKAMFHCWSHINNGVTSALCGIVEYEHGNVGRVDPISIRFIYPDFEEYYFPDIPDSREKH